MLANDSLDYFERRISRLESMYFRGQESNNPVDPVDVKNVENNNVLARIEEMDSKLNALSTKAPEIRQIISKLNQLYPLITQKRKSLREISEKVNEFQRSKNEINEHLNSLNVLKSLTPVINKETYAGKNLFILDLRLLKNRFLQTRKYFALA